MRHTRFFITGFGPFLPDAPYNPTQALVERLLAEGVVKAADGHANTNCRDFKLDCRVVAVETEAAVEAIEAIAACVKNEYINDECGTDNSRSVLIHLGVNTTLKHFQLERCAWNEADFRIPDAAGRQLRKEIICVEDGGFEMCRTTQLPLTSIAADLESLGHHCKLSDDPGRFLCNYIYYHSLRLSAAVNEQGRRTTTSLFVHVPPFTAIAQPAQEKFLSDLLRVVSTRDGGE